MGHSNPTVPAEDEHYDRDSTTVRFVSFTRHPNPSHGSGQRGPQFNPIQRARVWFQLHQGPLVQVDKGAQRTISLAIFGAEKRSIQLYLDRHVSIVRPAKGYPGPDTHLATPCTICSSRTGSSSGVRTESGENLASSEARGRIFWLRRCQSYYSSLSLSLIALNYQPQDELMLRMGWFGTIASRKSGLYLDSLNVISFDSKDAVQGLLTFHFQMTSWIDYSKVNHLKLTYEPIDPNMQGFYFDFKILRGDLDVLTVVGLLATDQQFALPGVAHDVGSNVYLHIIKFGSIGAATQGPRVPTLLYAKTTVNVFSEIETTQLHGLQAF